jgi:hypothetical protein
MASRHRGLSQQYLRTTAAAFALLLADSVAAERGERRAETADVLHPLFNHRKIS